MIDNIKTFTDLLTQEEVKSLLDYARSKDQWDPSMGTWDNRSLGVESIFKDRPDLAILLDQTQTKIKNAIEESYGLSKEINADLIQLVRWFPGNSQSAHADDMTNSNAKGFSHREFGAILYLNEDYVGGHTFYPQYNFEVIPKSGMLAVHPGTPDYLHGVTTVEESIRYTIASFWTSVDGFKRDYSFLY